MKYVSTFSPDLGSQSLITFAACMGSKSIAHYVINRYSGNGESVNNMIKTGIYMVIYDGLRPVAY